MDKLMGCPFCNREPRLDKSARYPRHGKHAGERVDGYCYVCDNPKCQIYHANNTYWLTQEAAFAAWNRRPGGWVSVKEKAPKKDGWYLCVVIMGLFNPSPTHAILGFHKGQWYSDCGTEIFPTHWMPLPKAPGV